MRNRAETELASLETHVSASIGQLDRNYGLKNRMLNNSPYINIYIRNIIPHVSMQRYFEYLVHFNYLIIFAVICAMPLQVRYLVLVKF